MPQRCSSRLPAPPHLCNQRHLADARDGVQRQADEVDADVGGLGQRSEAGIGGLHIHRALEGEVKGVRGILLQGGRHLLDG